MRNRYWNTQRLLGTLMILNKLMIGATFVVLVLRGELGSFRSASAGVEDGWVLRYSGTSVYFPVSVHQTTDGGFIVLDQGGFFVTLVKLRADRSLEWTKRYGGLAPGGGGLGRADGNAVQQTGDGGYILAGTALKQGAFLMKLRSDGNIVWAKTYGSLTDKAWSVQQTGDGGYIVAGERNREAVVMKLELDGTVVWARTYPQGPFAKASSIQQTRDGGYIVGVTGFLGGLHEIMKLRADGEVEWQKGYLGLAGAPCQNPIQQTVDGGYVATGTVETAPNNNDLLVMKLRSDGRIDWQKKLGGPLNDAGCSIAQTDDGGYIIKGDFTEPCGSPTGPDISRCFKIWVIKLDTRGRVIWQKTYGGIDEEDYSFAIEQTSDGGFIVAGSLQIFGTEHLFDGWLLKLNPDGSLPPSCDFVGEPEYVEIPLSREPIDPDLGQEQISMTFQELKDISIGEPDMTFEFICGEPPPPDPDRYEANDGLEQAASVTEDWEHPHHWLCSEWMRWELLAPEAECPDVFEHGLSPPGYGAEEVWTMIIPDLSIASTTERDFFRISIPDPGNPDDGGHNDIRPSTPPHDSDPEPLPECGTVHREGYDLLGNPISIDIGITGKLIVTVVPISNSTSDRPISGGGETIQLYRDLDGDGTLDHDNELGSPEGASLQKTIICPRSRGDLAELVFSFGERDDPRASIFSTGGYEIRLVYKIEISREFPPPVFADEQFEQFVGELSCLYLVDPFIDPVSLPSDDFPYCPSVLDINFPNFKTPFRLELGHPMDASRSCDIDGCPEYFTFHWPAVNEPFDVIFASDVGLTFELFDDEHILVGEAVPFQPTPTDENSPGPLQAERLSSVAAADPIEKRLYIPQLERGLYLLRVGGSQAVYTVSFITFNQADLSITKANETTPISAGGNLSYTIQVTNNGPSSATGVTITDSLPAGVTFVSATTSQGNCIQASGSVACYIGDLPGGANATVTILVIPTAGGTIINIASVAGNQPDPDNANNTAIASTTVIQVVPIDIKPGQFPNRIRFEREDDDTEGDGGRKVRVAILSTPGFNAPDEVDQETLTFGHSGNENSLHWRGNDQPNCSILDVNQDGQPDLVCSFLVRKTGFQPQDTVGILKGKTLAGASFEAQDSVIILIGPERP